MSCIFLVCLAGVLRASRLIIRQSRLRLCLLFSSLPQAYFLLWSAGQTRLDSWVWVWACWGGSAASPRCVAPLESSRQRVSHLAAALCVCVPDSRSGTYCVVLVFAFEKAATVSLVVVQQWVRVSVCVCVCESLWMQDSGKSSIHSTELISLYLISSYYDFSLVAL